MNTRTKIVITKKIKVFPLLVLLTLIFSCSKADSDPETQFVNPGHINFYYLRVSIQDAFGIDQLKGIAYNENTFYVEPSLYTLYAVPSVDLNPRVMRLGQLRIIKTEDNDYLEFVSGCWFEDPVVTFMFSCPYIFGDNERRKIISYWKPGDKAPFLNCYRILFNGKEYPATDFNSFWSTATLVL